MIIFDNISLSFSDNIVLKELTFHIKAGENVCISGPSGKGKSSVLKIMQGYFLPDNGVVEIDGLELNVENIKAIRSQMAYVPQNINLPVDNGWELLKLLNATDHKELAVSYAHRLGLSSGMIIKQFDNMSVGQKQRVVIAVCLSLNRSIILMDEPTASLDDESVKKIIDVVNDLHGKTIVSASHNQMWMESVDRSVVL